MNRIDPSGYSWLTVLWDVIKNLFSSNSGEAPVSPSAVTPTTTPTTTPMPTATPTPTPTPTPSSSVNHFYINQTQDFEGGYNIGETLLDDRFPCSHIKNKGCGFVSALNALYDLGYYDENDDVYGVVQDALDFLAKGRPSNKNWYYDGSTLSPFFFIDYIDHVSKGAHKVSGRSNANNKLEKALKNGTTAIVHIADVNKELFDADSTYETGTSGHYMYVKYNKKTGLYHVDNPNTTGSNRHNAGTSEYTFKQITDYIKKGFYLINKQ